jgi:hypothetical protein
LNHRRTTVDLPRVLQLIRNPIWLHRSRLAFISPPSASANTNFLKKLKKIWKGNSRTINTQINTRDHTLILGSKQRSPTNLNETDKPSLTNLHKNSFLGHKGTESSIGRSKKLDYNGEWPANSHHKNRSFDPKNILKNMKETSLERSKYSPDKIGNTSGLKDINKSGLKNRTVKEGKSKSNLHLNQCLVISSIPSITSWN